MRSARYRELWNLLFVALVTAIGFLSVYTARQQEIDSTSLIYAGYFLALYAVAHIGLPSSIRRTACRALSSDRRRWSNSSLRVSGSREA